MMHVTTIQYYTNVSECDDSIRYTAPSDQIDTVKIYKRIGRSEKFPTILELSNLRCKFLLVPSAGLELIYIYNAQPSYKISSKCLERFKESCANNKLYRRGDSCIYPRNFVCGVQNVLLSPFGVLKHNC